MDFKPFKIGKYLLLEKLATGGMAEVYRAKASGAGGFEKQLAIKRILPNYSANEEFRRMFEYEAQLSSRLTHANIVQVYDFVKSGDTYLLAMEYVDGKNLRQLINKARKRAFPLSIAFSTFLVNEVCKGLDYAHRKKDDLLSKPLNIIHRDMSPQNIMLSYDGAVKIVDFGIAKAKDRVDETRSGVIKGKFGYMSPEQANGQPIDHRSDIFSTAIILWELLTNQRLFSAENDMATLKLIQECVVSSPSRLNPKIPTDLERIVMKGLVKDLSLRYQSAGIFHKHLQEFLSKHYPSFTQKDAADTVQKVFDSEIEKEKKRYEQLYRQSIPFSQGEQSERQAGESSELEDLLEGEITRSELVENTPVTAVDEQVPPISEGEPKAEGQAAVPEPSEPTQLADTGESTIDDTDADSLVIDNASSKSSSSGPASAPSAKTPKGSQSDIFNPLSSQSNSDKGSASAELRRVFGKSSITPLSDPNIVPSGGGEGKSDSTPSKGSTPRTDPELILRNEDPETVRRRDRSISALSEINQQSSDGGEISLVSLNEADADDSRKTQKQGYRMPRTDYWPRRKRSRFPFLVFLLVAAGTAYLYRLYLEGRFVSLLEGLRKDNVVATPEPVQERQLTTNKSPEPTDLRPVGDCTISLTTDPSGVKVFWENREVGATPTTIGGNCHSVVTLTLRYPGFEETKEKIALRSPLLKIHRILKKIPMGNLTLTVTRNAEIYVDGQHQLDAEAGKEVALPVTAGGPHKVRFVNKILGIDVTRELAVEADRQIRETIRLESQ